MASIESREHPPDDPALRHAAAPLTARFRVLGHDVRVESNDARLLRAADACFGPPLSARPAANDAVARLMTHAVEEDAPWAARQPVVRYQGDLFTLAASRATTVGGDLRAGFAFGFISEIAAADFEFLRQALVPATVYSLLSGRFIATTHAACVVRDGRALLLRGESRAGKTTLAYAALRRGWSLLADDAVWIAGPAAPAPLRATDLELRGVPTTISLLPESAALFPELGDIPPLPRLSGKIKRLVDLRERFPGQMQPTAPLGPLVFIRRHPGATPAIARLPRDNALARLDATTIVYERDAADQRGLWHVLLELPVYELQTGDDPEANASMLDRILSLWGDDASTA